jgi:hypothetical protein
MLPDGLSDVELVQSKLPIDNILGCKAALIRTTLAHSDEQKRIKLLVPIREYMQKIRPPGDHLIRPLLKHFQELLEFYDENNGTQSGSGSVARISSNYSNVQNLLRNGLQQDYTNLANIIYCICHLNTFSQHIGRGTIPLFGQIYNVIPQLCDHRLKAYFIMELFDSHRYYQISNPETLVARYSTHSELLDDTDLECTLH